LGATRVVVTVRLAGQNGFKLSLLGFEPEEDHEYLVKEAQRQTNLSSLHLNTVCYYEKQLANLHMEVEETIR
jgi:hypothetical protein